MTGARVGRLYLPPGASQFASRLAHGLAYACQTESINERAARRRRKLLARLGDGDAPYGWIPLKPKGMRWMTYIRQVRRIQGFESLQHPKF